MEVIKGLFGKAQATAEEVVQTTKKDDGYSRDISTCPGMSQDAAPQNTTSILYADSQATLSDPQKIPSMG